MWLPFLVQRVAWYQGDGLHTVATYRVRVCVCLCARTWRVAPLFLAITHTLSVRLRRGGEE